MSVILQPDKSSVRTSDTGDGLLAGEIGDMDESVVERGVDVSDTKDELSLSNLGTESSRLGLSGLDLLGGLHPKCSQLIHPIPVVAARYVADSALHGMKVCSP